MRIFLLYAVTIIGWGMWTVVMRVSGMKPFIGAATIAIVYALICIVPFAAHAQSETDGLAWRMLVIGIVAGVLNGAGAITFQMLRYEVKNFLSMNLITIMGIISVNVIGARLLIGDPITFKKAVGIAFAFLAAFLLA